MKGDFTQAQEAALARAQDILREHFDTSVILVLTDNVNDDSGTTEVSTMLWSGGKMSSLGLLENYRRKLLSTTADRDGEDDDN